MKTLQELEKQYTDGVNLLKQEGYYQEIVEEIHLLVKYLDSQWLTQLLSENLFTDIQGVFLIFVREDLKEIYAELKYQEEEFLVTLFKRDSVNLRILRKCSTSLTYQVKSIIRMPAVRDLAFKSRYLENISRKLSGEIQRYYQSLEQNYKEYFRKTFSRDSGQQNMISLGCLKVLERDFQEHFLLVTQKFPQLAQAISFVKDVFAMELESRVRRQLSVFFSHQEKLDKLIDYFIDDLKRSLIQNLHRQIKQGRDYTWIRKGLENFIQSERFGTLLRKVIYQTFSIMQKNHATV